MSFSYAVTAHNSAPESDNRIHADDVAGKLGFSGGLVPGVDVFAYMTRVAVDAWGWEFLEAGAMRARFVKPVYDGDAVTVTGVPSPDKKLAVSARARGEVCAEGEAFLDPGSSEVQLRQAAPAWYPGAPAATPETLPKGLVLGPIREFYLAEEGRHHLADMRETHPVYQRGRVAHPGYLLRRANYILSYNVKLGPWIHIESDVRLHDTLHDGEHFETRADIADNYEKGGHRIVALDFSIFSSGRAIMTGRHWAIYEPRQLRERDPRRDR